MDANYNKLFKLLIDKNMKKGELAAAAGVSGSSIAKIGRGENISVDILIKICRALDCTLDDIMEILPKSAEEETNDGH